MFVSQRIDLGPVCSARVRLVDLVRRKVGHVDVGVETGLERCADVPQAIPVDATEKVVALDLGGAILARLGAETMVGAA